MATCDTRPIRRGITSWTANRHGAGQRRPAKLEQRVHLKQDTDGEGRTERPRESSGSRGGGKRHGRSRTAGDPAWRRDSRTQRTCTGAADGASDNREPPYLPEGFCSVARATNASAGIPPAVVVSRDSEQHLPSSAPIEQQSPYRCWESFTGTLFVLTDADVDEEVMTCGIP